MLLVAGANAAAEANIKREKESAVWAARRCSCALFITILMKFLLLLVVRHLFLIAFCYY